MTLTPEQELPIDEKLKLLSDSLGKKVYAIVLESKTEPGGIVVGYSYAPDILTQLRLIDKGQALGVEFPLEAMSSVLDSLLIISESDKRISDKEDAEYWKGACLSLAQFMGLAKPVLKKK